MRFETALLLLLTLVTFIVLPIDADAAFIHVDSHNRHFRDANNSIRLFHGVNVVYKEHPWMPDTNPHTPWNPTTTLNERDIDFLVSIGVTVIRLGMMWPGVEVGDYAYNSTYLSSMEELVNRLGQRGIYTLLDAHQDLIARKFCGEGAPEFLISARPDAQSFPRPVTPLPYPVDPRTGEIPLSVCLQMNFYSYYWSEAVSSAFQRFYDNVNNAVDHFASFWRAVAIRFRENPFVVGYEILNEPWPGDIYLNPDLEKINGMADVKNLLPVYNRVYEAIRSVDREHTISYECNSHGSDDGAGFEYFPGREEAANSTFYSYHVYCSDSDSHLDPKNWTECVEEYNRIFNVRLNDAKRIVGSGASLLTEFGANDNRAIGIQAMNYVLGKADENIQGWIYWQYKYYQDLTTSGGPTESLYNEDGSLQVDKVRALARTYAPEIAGIPSLHQFNPDNGQFELEYIAECTGTRITQVFYSTEYYYPNGVNVAIVPTKGISMDSKTVPHHLLFTLNDFSLCGSKIRISMISRA